MPIETTINQEQKDQLQQYLNSGSYPDAYNLIRDIIEADPNGNESAAAWFNNAAHINADDGSYVSEYTRTATIWAGAENGVLLSEGDFNEASNRLAQDGNQGVRELEISPISH